MEEILLLTDVTTASVYIIIFALIFMIGYVTRALSLYNTSIDKGYTKEAAFAWYPFTSAVTMGKLAGSTFYPALITSILFFGTALSAVVVMALNKIIISWLIWLCVGLYAIYSISCFFLLKKYMNKFTLKLTLTGLNIIFLWNIIYRGKFLFQNIRSFMQFF